MNKRELKVNQKKLFVYKEKKDRRRNLFWQAYYQTMHEAIPDF